MSQSAIEVIKHHIPIAAGALVAVLIVALIEKWAIKQTKQTHDNNLYVVYSPCMKVAEKIRIFNDTGKHRMTDTNGVIYSPPFHWTKEGTTLRAVIEDKIYILQVAKGGLLAIPEHCPGAQKPA